jgi:acyl carrier protein
MEQIREQLRTYIVGQFLPGEDVSNLEDDTPLRTSGILDSIATLQLVSFVEQQYGIEVEARDLGVETFDRIEDIARLIERKRSGAAV